MNTKDKGDFAEIEAIRFFKQNGYSVSIPFGDNDPYDLIIESPNKNLYRIQVRYSAFNEEYVKVRLTSTSRYTQTTLDFQRVEAFVIFDSKDFYIVPTSQIANKCALHLRKLPAKNNQKEKIHLAENFLNNLSFLK